jgi:hypothetical protein
MMELVIQVILALAYIVLAIQHVVELIEKLGPLFLL